MLEAWLDFPVSVLFENEGGKEIYHFHTFVIILNLT